MKVPDMYLGININRWEIYSASGVVNKAYALGYNNCVKEAISYVKQQCKRWKIKYPNSKRSGNHPFLNVGCRAEL